MIDIIKNVSKITTIPTTDLKELCEKIVLCIGHETSLLDDGEISELDIGIGTLKIKYENDEISYKFFPSMSLEKVIIQAIKTGESPLTSICEEKMTKKLLATYKDLL